MKSAWLLAAALADEPHVPFNCRTPFNVKLLTNKLTPFVR